MFEGENLETHTRDLAMCYKHCLYLSGLSEFWISELKTENSSTSGVACHVQQVCCGPRDPMNQLLIKAATGSADEAVFLGLDSHLLFCLGRLRFPAIGLCADDCLSQGWWQEGRTGLCLVTDNPTCPYVSRISYLIHTWGC